MSNIIYLDEYRPVIEVEERKVQISYGDLHLLLAQFDFVREQIMNSADMLLEVNPDIYAVYSCLMDVLDRIDS